MIDFKNGALFKLNKSKTPTNTTVIQPILVQGETIISEYTAIRDFIVFTNKRIIAVNVQGITGKKKYFTSLPYTKVQAFSIETAGILDLDSELELYFSGLGKVKFEVSGSNDIAEIGKMISECILQIECQNTGRAFDPAFFNGVIHQIATPNEIITNPKDEYVMTFVLNNLMRKYNALKKVINQEQALKGRKTSN